MIALSATSVSLTACLMLASGCGSSAKAKVGANTATSSAATPVTPSRADYIAKADALCKTLDKELAPSSKELDRLGEITNEPTEQVAAKMITQYEKQFKIMRAFRDQFHALQQPPNDHSILTRVVAGHDLIIAGRERLLHLLRTNPEPAAYKELVKEIVQEDAPIYSLEQGYGFKVCGASSGSGSKAGSTNSASTQEEAGTSATLRIGQSAIVGPIRITLTSFAKLPSTGEAVKWRGTMTVKNVGSEPIQAFCGGEASLTDDFGRVYEGEAAINEANSEDCEGKLQPGLSGSHFIVDFKTAANAKPATVSLWGDSEEASQARVWKVH